MRKIYLSLLVVMLFVFTSCNSREQNYVKNIFVSKQDNKYVLVFQSYDFTSQEEKFKYEIINSSDINDAGILAVSQNNYNFRLCENIFIYPDLFYSDFDKVFTAINNLKIPPATKILCLTGEYTGENINTENLIPTPMYNFSVDKYGAYGAVQITDENMENKGALIINAGNTVKVLNEKEWKILNMLMGDKKGFSTTIRNNEIYVDFNFCEVYFITGKTPMINISLNLKEYKGIGNDLGSMELLRMFAENDISEIVYNLYNDVVIRQACNFDCYFEMDNSYTAPIDVNVKVV